MSYPATSMNENTQKRKCILHVGTMKTGTTTVQSWLESNKTQLAEQHWTYAGWPCRSSSDIKRLIHALPADQNLIISDEGLWHLNRNKSDTKEIASALRDFDVTVLVYFRRPDEFLEAWFKQGLKYGFGHPVVPRFLASKQVSARAFEARLKTFIRLFGKDHVQVAPYERAQLRNGDILDDFLHRTQIPRPPGEQQVSGKKNISPSADQMLLTGVMRSFFNVDQKTANAIMTSTPHDELAKISSSVFTSEEKKKIREEYFPVFGRIQKDFGSGVEPDFFVNWGAKDKPSRVSPVRGFYDHMWRLTSDQMDPPPSYFSPARMASRLVLLKNLVLRRKA